MILGPITLDPNETLMLGFGVGLLAAVVLVFAERAMNPRIRLLLLFVGIVLVGAALVVVVTTLREMPQGEPP